MQGYLQISRVIERLASGGISQGVKVVLRWRTEGGSIGFNENAVRRHEAEGLALGAFPLIQEVGGEGKIGTHIDEFGNPLRRAVVGMDEEA